MMMDAFPPGLTKEWRDVYPVQIIDANVELCKLSQMCPLWAFVFKLLHYKSLIGIAS